MSRLRLLSCLCLLVVACSGESAGQPVPDSITTVQQPATTGTTSGVTGGNPAAEPATTVTAPGGAVAAPDWLGQRTLPTLADGRVPPQTTPAELIDRRIITTDTLAPPPTEGSFNTIAPLAGEPLERSTWEPGCPVEPEDLRYLTVSFWGFDQTMHTGELIVHADVAEDVASVFATLAEARFPIEEMRVITPADIAADPTGDSNNTGSFVCRAVTGGSRFSEHAYGLAIDINPFQNPYERGDVVLPELAGVFLDRSSSNPGVIHADSIVVESFASIGWEWGGDWSSLKDYQHFALNNR